jgi:hypothetical protein
MTSIRIRKLTPPEERYLRVNEGKDIKFSGPLSIMGLSNHSFVRGTTHTYEARVVRIDLGGGQYIEDLGGCPSPPAGITVPIDCTWKVPLYYLSFVASDLGVPFFYIGLSFRGANCIGENHIAEDTGVTYLPHKYESAFAECLGLVGRTVAGYEKNRTLLNRWFGSNRKTDWDSVESNAIRAKIRQILMNVR